MMYPRLKLLYKLLSKDGVIFISLDDNEITYLRSVMNEIFGSSGFVTQLTLLSNPKGRSQDKYFANCHEYLLVYMKGVLQKGSFSVSKNEEKVNKDYKLTDSNGQYRLIELRNTHREFGKSNRPNLWYPIYVSASGSLSLEKSEEYCEPIFPYWPDSFEGCWTWGKELAQKDIQLLVGLKKNNVWKIFRKSYAVSNDGETAKQKPFTIWNNPLFYTEKGQVVFGQIFPGANKNDFPQPKSVDYIMEILRTTTSGDDIILDSFAGSGTTAHAVLKLNKQDNGNRKFILAELMDYANTVTAERAKRVISGYGDDEGTGGNFSYYELGEMLLSPDGNLNENVDEHKIREYVYYMDTKDLLPICTNPDNKYYLGRSKNTAYYFFYERNHVTTLDHNFLTTVGERADEFIIYADICTLSDNELKKHNIVFKKIPRDIAKL